MGAISFIETMDHTALSNITQEEFQDNVESAMASLSEEESGGHLATQSLLAATTPTTPSKPIISRVGTPISTFHVGEESAEPLTGGTSGSPPSSASPFAALQLQLSQLGGAGGPSQQNGLTPQTLGEDAKRLLQKTGDAVSKPLNALGRIFSEALDNAEDQLRFLPFGGEGGQQHPGQDQNPYSQTHGQYGQQFATPLHQTGGQIQTPYKPRVKRVNSPSTPPRGENGGGPSQGDQQGQRRQSWYESPTKMYTYSNQPLAVSPGETPGRSPSPAPSKLQSLLGFGFGDGQSSTAFDSPTPAIRPAPRQRHGRSASANPGFNNPDPSNNYGGGPQPPSESYASLVQAQESYLQSRQARTDAPDIQFLQAEIDRAHEKQSQASRDTLRQIFPGVDEEVLEWVLEGSEGQVERSIEMLLEITSGG